ncbi:hypothetical protein M758_5G119600 [Ceratodon purpureus]|nr:hypothetical protein M758_5G119600 [Ceratodon purpureus]
MSSRVLLPVYVCVCVSCIIDPCYLWLGSVSCPCLFLEDWVLQLSDLEERSCMAMSVCLL